MAHILTLLAENIFAVIGFTLYCGLVYYMITRVLHKHFGRGKNRKKKGGTTRKNYSRHVLPGSKMSGNDFT